MEIPGRNEEERNRVINSRVAVIPSTGVTVPLGDIDVESAILISECFNVSEFHAIEALAGSAGRIFSGTNAYVVDEEEEAQTRLFAAGNIFQERASCLESLSLLLRARQTVRALERNSNYCGANEGSQSAFREFSAFVDEVVLMGKRIDGNGNATTSSDEQTLVNRLAKLIRAAPKGLDSRQQRMVFLEALARSNKTSKCKSCKRIGLKLYMIRATGQTCARMF